MRSKLFFLVILALLVGGGLMVLRYTKVTRELAAAKKALEIRTTNDNILQFTRLFVDKVLNATEEVRFEDRLALEESVREIGDSAILDKWNAFIRSETEEEAQDAVRLLLKLLMEKARSI